MLEDLRQVARRLLRQPGFTLAVTATLALGMGANVVVYGVVRSVLLRPLPYPASESLVAVAYRGSDSPRFAGSVPLPALHAWRDESRTLERWGAYSVGEESLRLPSGEPLRVSRARLSPDFFATLGVQPVTRGRALAASDYRPGASAVMLFSHEFWVKYFGADETVLGRRFPYNVGTPELIGILGEGFQFPGFSTPYVFVPLLEPAGPSPVRFATVIGRLRPGVSIERAANELQDIDERAAQTYSSAMREIFGSGGRPHVAPLQNHIVGDLRRVLPLALATALLVLLLACSNVASLLLARTSARASELATRTALGATPGQLARGILLESALLGALGASAAVLTVAALEGRLRELLARTIPHADTVGFGYATLGFTGAAAGATILLTSILPIAQLRRPTTPAWLRGGQGTLAIGSVRPSWGRLLIGGQAALATTAVVGGLLLTATLRQVTNVDLGFDPSDTLTFRIPALSLRGGSNRHTEALVEIVDRVRRLPGVQLASASDVLPFGDQGGAIFSTSVEGGRPAPPDVRDGPAVVPITPDYFASLRVPLVAGREFQETDRTHGRPVAIVNRAFSEDYLGDLDPLGRRLTFNSAEIVGVVPNLRPGATSGRIDEKQRPTIYVPFSQIAGYMGWETATVIARTAGRPLDLAGEVRQAAVAVEPNAVVFDVRTMEERIAAFVTPERHRAVLFGSFALIALVLAGTGVYSLLAYTVAREMRQFGVRLALGASPQQIFVAMLRRALVPVGGGVVVGLAAALGFARSLSGFLFGVAATDVRIFVAAAAILTAAGLLASVRPAWRAMCADPLTVLRSE